LPSEAEIAAEFSVARGTVREALKLLEQSGLVAVKHGRGRFVSAIANHAVERPISTFESVTEMLRELGYQPTNRVLNVSEAIATDEDARALGVDAGTGIVRLERLRLHGGEALIYEISMFPSALLGDLRLDTIDFTGSLNEWLEERGRKPASSAARIQAVMLPARVAGLPEVDAEQPWLLITERCIDLSGAPVLHSQDFHRGDVFSFHVLRQRAS
jgi:GntR family transcriptional regulator